MHHTRMTTLHDWCHHSHPSNQHPKLTFRSFSTSSLQVARHRADGASQLLQSFRADSVVLQRCQALLLLSLDLVQLCHLLLCLGQRVCKLPCACCDLLN